MASLIHDPVGRQHPYEAAAFERTPAHPVVGDAVSIGIVTRPAGAWQDVRVEWWAGDGLQRTAEARLLDSGGFELRADEVAAGASNPSATVEDEDRWVAELPAVEGGAVRYQVHGCNGNEASQSELFEFGVARWVAARALSADHQGVRYRLDGIEREVTLGWYAGEHGLRLRWGDTTRQDDSTTIENARAVTARLDESGRLVVEQGGEAILRESQPPHFLVGNDGMLLRVRHAFVATANERFYGLGERYNALDQRGETLDVRVYEQYKAQGKRTYTPVPLLHSSQGYSLYLHTNRWSAFDLAASDDQVWSVDAELDGAATLDISLFVTASVVGNLAAYCAQTGLPKLPPDWTFSLWASSNDWETQRHVEEEMRQAREHNIPIGVVVLEAWSDEVNFYIWNDAQYAARPAEESPRLADFTYPSDGKWHNPKQMIDDLHAQGTRLLLWQIPVLKHVTEAALLNNPQHDADEVYMLAQGYAVSMPNGTPYRVRPPWFRGSLLPDFTSPAASTWWFSKRRYLVEEMGVDGFKTDGGEHLWAREASFADGRQGDELVNTYPLEYTRAYTEFLDDAKPGDSLLFSRAGFAGSQRYPAHWAGDEVSTWEAYRASVLAMLNAGLSGIPFIGWDIAGFSGAIPSAELYLRAAAMSVFCPIMQYHSEYWRGTPTRDRSPWNMQACTGDERIIPCFRRFVEWRTTLLPYIVASAKESARTGAPLMRALPVDFMNDEKIVDYPLQFLFGDSLLVAPITAPGVTEQKVYLPRGERWVDMWSGVEHEGGIEVTIDAPIERIPLFVRGGRENPLAAYMQ